MNKKRFTFSLLVWLCALAAVYAGTQAVTIDEDTETIINTRVVVGGALVFPDSDPHIVGAGFWSGGVLTQSAGPTPTATATSTPTATATATP